LPENLEEREELMDILIEKKNRESILQGKKYKMKKEAIL
jgi:hypothetical protein